MEQPLLEQVAVVLMVQKLLSTVATAVASESVRLAVEVEAVRALLQMARMHQMAAVLEAAGLDF